MMGHQHALGGVAAWLAALPVVHAATGPLTPGQAALGAVLAAGGGMVPDLDQRGSTVGRTYGPVTNVLARAVGFIAGGHRNGTHSLLGLAVTGALVFVVATTGWQWATVWLMLGVGIRGLRKGKHPWYAAIGLAGFAGMVTLLVAAADVDPVVALVGGVTLGAASHVALDGLTPQGVPLLWPFSKRRFSIPLVTTGSWSSPFVTGALTALVCLLGWLTLVTA